MRNPPVLEGRRSFRAAQAEGGDPVRRAGVGSTTGQPARARGNLQKRSSDPRHLLRPADPVRAARRQGGERPRGGIRPGGCRGPRAFRPVRGRLANGRPLPGVDEPRGPGDPLARRLPRLCGVGECALRRRGRRSAPLLHDNVPSRGGAHSRRREAARQFPFQGRRSQRRLDDGRLPPRGDRPHPRAGRQIARHLRPVGRSRFGGRGGADPRGYRRSAHLRVRRSWAHAARRSGRSGQSVPRPFQHSACSCRRRARVHAGARRRRRPRGQAQDDRQIVHRHIRRGGAPHRQRRQGTGRVSRAGHALSRRDRERVLFRRSFGRRSRATTMSAACRSACA